MHYHFHLYGSTSHTHTHRMCVRVCVCVRERERTITFVWVMAWSSLLAPSQIRGVATVFVMGGQNNIDAPSARKFLGPKVTCACANRLYGTHNVWDCTVIYRKPLIRENYCFHETRMRKNNIHIHHCHQPYLFLVFFPLTFCVRVHFSRLCSKFEKVFVKDCATLEDPPDY